MSTDAATTALVAVRSGVQALHEGVEEVAAADLPSPGAAADLADAATRLSALLGSLGEVLDAERTTPTREALDRLAATATVVRDAEVLTDLTDELLRAVPRSLVVGAPGDRIRHELRERRRRGADALAKAVRDEECVDVLGTADRLVITPPLAAGAGEKASSVLARAASADDDALTSALAQVGDATSDPETERCWRVVRDAARALAGSADAAAPEHGKQARKLAAAAEEVAGRATTLLDALAARRLLVDLADVAHRHREPGFTYGLLHAAAGERAAIADAAVDAAVDEVLEKKRRKWL